MNLRHPALGSIATLVLAVSLLSCHGESTPPAPPTTSAQATLYQRLGGEAPVRALVDHFVANVAADSRINHFFADTDFDQFKASFTNLIGENTGGPQKYTGRDMKTTHAGLGITGADFDALVEDLTHALDELKVGEAEKHDLLAILAPMRKDIVEK